MTKYEMRYRENFIRTVMQIVKVEKIDISEEEVVNTINTLHRHNATLRNQYVLQVNGNKNYNHKKVINLEERCQNLARKIGLSLAINTDPRGYPLEFWHNSYLMKFGW